MLTLLLLGHSPTLLSDSTVVITSRSKQVTLSISRKTGRFDISWGREASISKAYGKAQLLGGKGITTDSYSRHEIRSEAVKDTLMEATKVTVRHTSPRKPELRHTFWIDHRTAELAIRLDLLDPKGQGSNSLFPLLSDTPVKFPTKGPLQSLFVPYDNDGYARYSSQAWTGKGKDKGSYEVGALFDDSTRKGLVVGSIDHDLWKSAVNFHKGGGLHLQAGVTGSFTHDTQPHGTVTGKEIRSPRFVLGMYPDWRKGLERFGDLCASVRPPLRWQGDVPFGWNSWSGHKSKLQEPDTIAALDFVHNELPGLRNNATAYINLDSYWDNLTPAQQEGFVKKAHAVGLKAGIYWSPFVNWGEPEWNAVGDYRFKDIQLKDANGKFLPKHDGAWPLDPTHPGTLQRIDRQIQEFAKRGFDFIKLDFLTHGALEGKHFDPKIQTGKAAYNFGMAYMVRSIQRHTLGKPFFISLSIAPLFPHGYAHSRRISCDVFADIGASEYLLNSQNFGWWSAGRLYRFNDPDHACVYQAEGEKPVSLAEGQTRLTASVVGGGMILQGDNLTNPDARERVKAVFGNQAILDLAKGSPQFRPVSGSIGDKGGDLFVHHRNDGSFTIAAFNFSRTSSKTVRLPLSRVGASGSWSVTELWSGRRQTVSGSLSASLGPMESAVYRFTRVRR